VLVNDITQHRMSELELQRLNRELLNKNKELEQIVYVASHDLRSPLVNIHGFSKEIEHTLDDIIDILQTEEDINQDSKAILGDLVGIEMMEALDFIQTSTAKMDRLLNGLLRFSRLGRTTIVKSELDMNQLMHRVIDGLQFQIKEAGIHINRGDLPPCQADEIQMNQLMTNLVQNAIKYRKPGQRGIIDISGRTDGEHAIYCIADNGIGIPAEHQEHIFEIFHRLSPDSSEGEGLGLTIARKIINMHNGRIWVESEQGKGSKFFVAIPLEDAPRLGRRSDHT
jgi:signal transduction histidine kinase